MKKTLAIFLISVLTFALAACGTGEKDGDDQAAAKSFPMKVTDYLGNEMEFEKAPEKIASLSPSCTEILYKLGLGDKMVGVSNWCTYPEEASKVEKVGDTFSGNVEKIIELGAEVVFVSGQTAADSVSALDAAGIKVYSIGAKSLDDIYKSITEIGKITGTGEEAAEIVGDMKEEAEELRTEFAKYDKTRVFIDLGDLYSTSKEDYLGNSLELINAENIALNFDYSSPQLSAEAIIEKNPQVYICLSAKKDFVQPDGFDKIAAFKDKKVYFIDYDNKATDMITRDGPRFLDGLELLGNLIHTGKLDD